MQAFGVRCKCYLGLFKTNKGTFSDQPMTVLGKVRPRHGQICAVCSTCFHQPLNLACIETQIGDGSPADCEILELDGSSDIRLKLL